MKTLLQQLENIITTVFIYLVVVGLAAALSYGLAYHAYHIYHKSEPWFIREYNKNK